MRTRLLWVFLLTLLSVSVHAETREYVNPPYGFVAFCERNEIPKLCESAPEGALKRLTVHMLAQIDAVNTLVNKKIKERPDAALYGVLEHWTIPSWAGDCEDFALLKQKLLLEQGYPLSSLLITVVFDDDNEGHAVLVIHTETHNLVLDNKRKEIVYLEDSGYRPHSRQSVVNPRVWVDISPRAPVVAAK